MRNFVKMFLALVLGVVLGRYSETISFNLNKVISAVKSGNVATVSKVTGIFSRLKGKSKVVSPELNEVVSKRGMTVSKTNNVPSELKNEKIKSDLNAVFSELKNTDKETLIVFNCKGIIFSYLDAAFSKENKNVWSDFSKKRSNFDRKKNEKIDRALFFAPKRMTAMEYRQGFKDLADHGSNMVFVYQIDENMIKFPNEEMIRSVVSSMLSDIGLSPNENPHIKLLVTDSKKISSDLANVMKELEKSESEAASIKQSDNEAKRQSMHKTSSVNKIVLVHEGSLKIDSNQISLPIEEKFVNFCSMKSNVTKDQMKKQIEILEKIGEWIHDMKIREITNCANDEELVYNLCKQSIMDVCSCTEIVEKEIYKRISSIVDDKNVLKNVEEIIDDFQEIHNTLPNIFHYAFRKYLWESCLSLNIQKEKAIELLKKIKYFDFNEYEVQSSVYKIVRKLGCGIHWRDMAKYKFAKNFLVTGDRSIGLDNSPRYRIYLKVMNIIFDRVISGKGRMVDDKKGEFIKILHENGIENSKIMRVFNISEEKFKNITNDKTLKNEEFNKINVKKIEKLQKTT